MKDYNQQEWREKLDSLKSPGDYFEEDFENRSRTVDIKKDAGNNGRGL